MDGVQAVLTYEIILPFHWVIILGFAIAEWGGAEESLLLSFFLLLLFTSLLGLISADLRKEISILDVLFSTQPATRHFFSSSESENYTRIVLKVSGQHCASPTVEIQSFRVLNPHSILCGFSLESDDCPTAQVALRTTMILLLSNKDCIKRLPDLRRS